jgi:sugar lactone lactonase YvrE
MPQLQIRVRFRHAIYCSLALVALFAACEEETAPGPTPVDVEIVSGNDQYSKQGTELEQPIIVQVTLSDGEPGASVVVRFAVKTGGGTVSQASAATNAEGYAGVEWTLGTALGTQELGISLADDAAVATEAQATSSVYYCPEEDPTFVRRFFDQYDLFLFTKRSSVTESGGTQRAGVVHLDMDTANLKFGAAPPALVAFDETVVQAVVRDCAFSSNGEFFIAWTNTAGRREIAKIASNGLATHFATLQGLLGSEITTLEGGVLAGCDEFGPFTVGCRDTLTRYPDATYSGVGGDLANYDAVAFDPTNDFLYFIDQPAQRLKCIPLDGYTQLGPVEEIPVALTVDETTGANGMVVHPDGSVYILVESTATKSIVRVTRAGAKSTVFDFFDRAGSPGIQDDLALLQAGAAVALYTLDTLNNLILIYQINPVSGLFEIIPDSNTDQHAASNSSSGERVGLAVLP